MDSQGGVGFHGVEPAIPLPLLHARFTLTRQLNSLAGWITSNVTLEYSLLERRESTITRARGSSEEDSFPLYTEIVRIAIVKKDRRFVWRRFERTLPSDASCVLPFRSRPKGAKIIPRKWHFHSRLTYGRFESLRDSLWRVSEQRF